ncbi:MAG: BamA/TamA family outer membrane protein [Magnetococcales bacterium]|nr:BamA/TamA family outer membrane protein [Magnetococcales bacterium]
MKKSQFFWVSVVCWLMGFGFMMAGTARAVDETLAYTVVFRGVEDDSSLQLALESVSVTRKRQEQPPANMFLLRRRAKDDGETFVQLLHSKGWFDASVEPSLTGEGALVVITFSVVRGERYRLGVPQLRLLTPKTEFIPPTMELLGLKEGNFAESDPIFAAADQLLVYAHKRGFPEARLVDRRYELDRAAHRLDVVLDLLPGPLVRLGKVHFTGDEGVDQVFLDKHLSWRPGAVYHPKRMERIQRAFMGTGLFATVNVALERPSAEGELWPVAVHLTQRKHKTIAAGGGYSTDKGINLKGAWEHRNIFHRGQRIKVNTELGTDAQSAFLSHETPDFILSGQKLSFAFRLDRNREDAYESQALQVGATVLRPVLAPGGEASLGLEWRIADVIERSDESRASFATTAIPLGLKLDRSDDLLDPGQGWRWNSEVKPVFTLSSAGDPYVRFANRGSVYRTLSAVPRVVLAARGEADTVWGTTHDNLAADQRLYAGGGGTLRGVGYQLAGPLDQEHKPIGGRSLLALGTEVRWRAWENVGLVGFVDGARSYEGEVPDLSEGMLFGAGVGGRYVTPIGPIRMDVGFPLRKRSQVDDSFQIYVSIGQAF